MKRYLVLQLSYWLETGKKANSKHRVMLQDIVQTRAEIAKIQERQTQTAFVLHSVVLILCIIPAKINFPVILGSIGEYSLHFVWILFFSFKNDPGIASVEISEAMCNLLMFPFAAEFKEYAMYVILVRLFVSTVLVSLQYKIIKNFYAKIMFKLIAAFGMMIFGGVHIIVSFQVVSLMTALALVVRLFSHDTPDMEDEDLFGMLSSVSDVFLSVNRNLTIECMIHDFDGKKASYFVGKSLWSVIKDADAKRETAKAIFNVFETGDNSKWTWSDGERLFLSSAVGWKCGSNVTGVTLISIDISNALNSVKN